MTAMKKTHTRTRTRTTYHGSIRPSSDLFLPVDRGRLVICRRDLYIIWWWPSFSYGANGWTVYCFPQTYENERTESKKFYLGRCREEILSATHASLVTGHCSLWLFCGAAGLSFHTRSQALKYFRTVLRVRPRGHGRVFPTPKQLFCYHSSPARLITKNRFADFRVPIDRLPTSSKFRSRVLHASKFIQLVADLYWYFWVSDKHYCAIVFDDLWTDIVL